MRSADRARREERQEFASEFFRCLFTHVVTALHPSPAQFLRPGPPDGENVSVEFFQIIFERPQAQGWALQNAAAAPLPRDHVPVRGSVMPYDPSR